MKVAGEKEGEELATVVFDQLLGWHCLWKRLIFCWVENQDYLRIFYKTHDTAIEEVEFFLDVYPTHHNFS